MKFAVIGNPIDKSLSPQLHNILYEKLNISNCSFEKICLENDELDIVPTIVPVDDPTALILLPAW